MPKSLAVVAWGLIYLLGLPLSACQEQPTNPLPAPEPVDMAWLQAEIAEHTGAPAEPDAIAPVLEALAQMQAIADEVRSKHEQEAGVELPERPGFGWLLPRYEDLEAPEGLLPYTEEVFGQMEARGVWTTLEQAVEAEGLNVSHFKSHEAFKEQLQPGELRTLIEAAELRCHRAALAGDSKAVAESIGHVLTMARVTSAASTPISFLSAASAQNKAEEMVRRHRKLLAAERGQIERLAALTDRHSRIVPLEVSFELEHRFGRSGLDLLYVPVSLKRSDASDVVRVAPAEGSPFVSPFGDEESSKELAPLTEILAAMDQLDRALLDAVSIPRSQRAVATKRLLALSETFDASVWPVNSWAGAYIKFVDEHDERLTRMALLRTMLAVELFRHNHNRFPVTLDELVPAYVTEIPADPLGRGPVRYRRVHDDETLPGNPEYLLYSVGVDGEDDGGKLPVYDHDAFTDLERTRGCDYIINISPDRHRGT